MKKFEDYSEEIYKCSKCGLCQSVCPIYKVTLNECDAARGKLILLNGIINNEHSFKDITIDNLDLCLNCNACRDFCPSSINTKDILASAKNQYKKENNSFSIFDSLNYFKFKMNILKILITTYRFLKLDKFSSILIKNSKGVELLNSLIPIKIKYKKQEKQNNTKGKIAFFESCFTKYLNPSSKNATLNILEKMGYEIIIPKTNCCGNITYHAGNFEEFEKNAIKNLKVIPKDVDYILSDCDKCVDTLKMYDKIENIKKISSKVISLSDFLIKNNFTTTFAQNISFSYHKPCITEQEPIELFKNLKNTAHISHENSNTCCGFSGEFGLKYQEISKKISKEKAKDIINAKAQIITTTCPFCSIGLTQGLIENESNIPVLNISEFIELEKSKKIID